MSIEYDENKRAVTLAKRGLDFEDTRKVFAGRTISQIDNRKDYDEERIITAGKLNGRHVVIVWTARGENRRIISMRYANEREKRHFGSVLD